RRQPADQGAMSAGPPAEAKLPFTRRPRRRKPPGSKRVLYAVGRRLAHHLLEACQEDEFLNNVTDLDNALLYIRAVSDEAPAMARSVTDGLQLSKPCFGVAAEIPLFRS